MNSGARGPKAIAEIPGAGGAGGEFGDQIRLNTPGVAVAPNWAEIGREIGRKRESAQMWMREVDAEGLARGDVEGFEVAVQFVFEAAFEPELVVGVEGVAGIFGKAIAGG